MLYKYRSLKNFKYFVDIILNQRLYASPYFELNDPMEGYYLYSEGSISEDILKKLKGEKEKIRICSLTSDCYNELMWSHYADGHRGIVIGVEIDRNYYKVKPIIYDGLLNVNNFSTFSQHRTAIEILSHKLSVWKYEKEERIFTNGKSFVNVEVKKIIIGQRMSNIDKSIIKKLVKKINPDIIIEHAKINQHRITTASTRTRARSIIYKSDK